LEKESSEEFELVEIEKDFFHMKQDLYVCSVYIPPQNSPREQRLDCDHFELFQENIYKFSKSGNITLCGDFNARLGTLDDYVHEIDRVTFPTTVLTSSIEPHKSRDIHINTYGKSLAELCCRNELIILTKGDYIPSVLFDLM
jgi:exonuclease III